MNVVSIKKTNKVFVGLSGGVDSSVSAALLKQAGYDVTGVFIKVWQPDWIECTWRDDRRDAMRICATLDIPFVTLDLEKEYKQGVIDYMIAEYVAGRTPNPDVMCNREVKFGAFWKWAKVQGADFVATGHYAQIQNGRLLMGVDKNKDQSYFLWTLNQDDLGHILFPVGHLEKPEVRKLAEKHSLATATKKDSQGLCFIGKVDIKEFLAHYVKDHPAAQQGNVLDEQGKVIGSHSGALFFTIGERHGFTLNSKMKSPHDEALYVISKDVKNNTITVAPKVNKNEHGQKITLHSVNWTHATPLIGSKFKARGRYRQELQDVTITEIKKDHASIVFAKEQETITPGQSLVVYDGEVCVGGGIID